MPRQPHKPNKDTRKTVEAMTGYGIPQDEICRVVEVSLPTLHKYYRKEIDTGATKANAKVVESLFQNCMAGNVTGQIWWTKTRMRWKETTRQEHTGEDGGPIEVVDPKELARRIMTALGMEEKPEKE